MKKLSISVVVLLLAGCWLLASAQETSLADAARQARAKKKNAPQAKLVFTNDNLPSPSAAPISTIGSAPSAVTAGDTTAAVGAPKATSTAKNPAEEEAQWRKKFAELRAKIATDEKEIDIMQRELNLNQQQYYGDPNIALREQYSRSDINKGKSTIDDKKKELAALKQQLSELEDDLRRAGAPSSWGSQP